MSATPEQDKFCDRYCTWRDHHPDCVRAQPQPVAWRFRLHPDKLPGSRWRVTDEYEHVAAMAARGDWEVVPLIEMKEDLR